MKKLEKILYPLIYLHVIIGIAIAFYDRHMYERGYVLEDGYIEWLTVLALVLGAGTCIQRIKNLKSRKNTFFLFCTAILAGLFLFGAGEEISWGQRIFNWESGAFFKKHNIQSETNLHNLVVSGKKINKIIFGTGLGIMLGLYFLILPIFYSKKKSIKDLIDRFAIPMPRPLHVGAYLLLFLLVQTVPGGKKGELLEFGGCWIFFLLNLYPLNREIYD